jgi:hypothetical protein
MSDIVQSMTVEETVEAVLNLMSSGYEGMPRALLDLVVMVGQFDRYKQDLALRLLRAKVKKGGSHHHLTLQKRWGWYRERWGEELGLERRRPELDFQPTTDTVQALSKVVNTCPNLPISAREAVYKVQQRLAIKANRKLDETSATLLGEGVEDLVQEIEVQARVINEQQARIEQAEHHNEHLRFTTDRLLALMDKLSGGTGFDGAVTVVGPQEGDRGSTRSRTN